jgi:hypothetical protein
VPVSENWKGRPWVVREHVYLITPVVRCFVFLPYFVCLTLISRGAWPCRISVWVSTKLHTLYLHIRSISRKNVLSEPDAALILHLSKFPMQHSPANKMRRHQHHSNLPRKPLLGLPVNVPSLPVPLLNNVLVCCFLMSIYLHWTVF